MADVRDVTWRFINAAPIIGRQAALDDLFAEALRPFGVDRFDCGRLAAGHDGPQFQLISNCGLTAWNRYYFEQGYNETDPSGVVCARFSGAYTWTDVKAASGERLEPQMWNDARAGGMREGLIVPTAPGRVNEITVRLTTPEDRFDPDSFPLLQSISIIYASTSASLATVTREKSAPIESSKSLTDREIECLHWSARGKTNAEIGVILKVSRHTVNTHIESAKKKLGVATRMQAVGIAHCLGLLSIA